MSLTGYQRCRAWPVFEFADSRSGVSMPARHDSPLHRSPTSIGPADAAQVDRSGETFCMSAGSGGIVTGQSDQHTRSTPAAHSMLVGLKQNRYQSADEISRQEQGAQLRKL
jgi:hypothetical protein